MLHYFNVSVCDVAFVEYALFIVAPYTVPLFLVAVFDVALFIVALFTIALMLHYINFVRFHCFNIVLFDVVLFSCCII